jgi:hypothetical protein
MTFFAAAADVLRLGGTPEVGGRQLRTLALLPLHLPDQRLPALPRPPTAAGPRQPEQQVQIFFTPKFTGSQL